MPDKNPHDQQWPRNLSNAELAELLEREKNAFSPELLAEAQRRQALDWLHSHVDQEPT